MVISISGKRIRKMYLRRIEVQNDSLDSFLDEQSYDEALEPHLFLAFYSFANVSVYLFQLSINEACYSLSGQQSWRRRSNCRKQIMVRLFVPSSFHTNASKLEKFIEQMTNFPLNFSSIGYIYFSALFFQEKELKGWT